MIDEWICDYKKRSYGATSARCTQCRQPAEFQTGARLPLQPVPGCQLTNEHNNEHANKHDDSQYLLVEGMINWNEY